MVKVEFTQNQCGEGVVNKQVIGEKSVAWSVLTKKVIAISEP